MIMPKKPFRFIWAVVFMATLAVSCGKDDDDGAQGPQNPQNPQEPGGKPTNICTVTFVGENESTTQAVLCGGVAKEPKKPPEKLEPGLYLGAPSEYRFDGWFADGATAPFDFDTPIGADISLRARWTRLSSSTLVAEVAANNVVAAIAYVNANPEDYTLVLDADVEINNTQTLDVPNVKLTMVGARQERNITYSTNQSASQLFYIDASGTTLTLGKNITLQPKGMAFTTAVKVANNDSHLVMLDGSKITGFSYTAVQLGVNSGSGSHSSFRMKGGEITGNKTFENRLHGVGGLSVEGGTTFHMSGGSVSGNFSAYRSSSSSPDTPADVYINSSGAEAKITLSDNAVIGNLLLSLYFEQGQQPRSGLTIGNTYSGEVSKLHLLGGATTWKNLPVIQAETGTLTANDIAKFGLGEFRTESGNPQPISNTHKINESGILVEK